MIKKTPEILCPALRLYRYSTDNSPSLSKPEEGLVPAFEYDETVKVVTELQADLAALREGLNEAMSWNWLDDDMNDEVANRLAALLQEQSDE